MEQLLPLFKCKELGTKKIDCGDKKPCFLHSQTGNWVPSARSMTASGWLLGIFINYDAHSKILRNGFAFPFYALFVSVKKLRHMIQSNTTDFLRIQRERQSRKNMPTSYRKC